MKSRNIHEFPRNLSGDLNVSINGSKEKNPSVNKKLLGSKAKYFLTEKSQKCVSNLKDFDHVAKSNNDITYCQKSKDTKHPAIGPQWESQISSQFDDTLRDEDEIVVCGSEGDSFYKVLQTKAPKANETSSLLDDALAMREDLEKRIKNLATFKKEIQEIGKLMKIDEFQFPRSSKSAMLPKTNDHQQTVALAGKVLSSVQQTTHKIQTLCTELDEV
ncbi:hypothetical protein J6590_054667 [Homalodisca vitripennis]|nr:hypothetical protein J6590_054667 [Homalodisca vitripennis]